jgi:hypothetical protein
MKPVVIALATLFIVAVLYGLYRMRSTGDLTVCFVVPDGYQGIFRLVIDPHAEQPTQEGGVWVYRIPEDGVLRVKKHWPLSDWHRPTAVYRSGKPLDAAQLPPGKPYRDEIRVHSTGSATHPDGSQTMDFFVGTDRQMLEIFKSVDRPLGGVVR